MLGSGLSITITGPDQRKPRMSQHVMRIVWMRSMARTEIENGMEEAEDKELHLIIDEDAHQERSTVAQPTRFLAC